MYNGYGNSKYRKALPNAYQRLDKFECCDLKSAIQAIQEVFLLKKEVENYTNFQIGGDGTAIGAHKFSVSSDWSEYQNGDISILNYKTKAELQSMTLKEFNVTKGFQAVKWFKEQFGYSEGATQLLKKWNPDVDLRKLKIGKAVMLMQ